MSILVVIIVVLFCFFVEVKCALPFYFKHKSFQEVVDYPPIEHVEIVDHPPLIEILILHISLAISISK
jgi:hypothetical protein